MRFDQLLILVDLSKTHSFNQTAERHYTTQQTISYSVKQLEKELGVQIFHRSKLGVEFTPEGEYVLEFARKMVESHQEMLVKLNRDDALKTKGNQPPEKIRLNISSVVLVANMPEVMETFGKVFPSTHMSIREVSHAELLPTLADGSCDMAVWCINKKYFEQNMRNYRSDGISYEIIKEDKPVAVVSLHSELANREILSREDLARSPKNIFGLLPLDYFGKDTVNYALYEDNNPAIHRQMLSDSNIICFMSEDTYGKFFKDNGFVAKPFNYPVQPLYHVLFRNNTQHKAYELLSDIIKRVLKSKAVIV